MFFCASSMTLRRIWLPPEVSSVWLAVTHTGVAVVRRIADDTLKRLSAADDIGLATNPIGIHTRVLVMDLARKDGKNEPRVFINPKILWTSEETAVCQEGCLSVPDIWEEVE